jgi:ribonuclease R
MARIPFTPDIMIALADRLDMFQPAGLNDNRRIDKTADRTGPPFMAIDPANATEIDDAIRVRRHRSGSFTVEVAIADGSQLATHSQLIQDAVDMRASTYDMPFSVPMLPSKATGTLNLRGYTSRALVVSRRFSKDLEPADEVSIEPASVSVENTSYEEFGLRSHQNYRFREEDPLICFQRMYRFIHGRDHISPREIDNAEISKRFANKLVATYMVLANIAVADWSRQRGVPILFRNFDPEEYERRDKAVGVYSVLSGVHADIRRQSGLDSATYTHATSPLRRAVDLVNHLQIGHYLADATLPYTVADLEELSEHFNYREQVEAA